MRFLSRFATYTEKMINMLFILSRSQSCCESKCPNFLDQIPNQISLKSRFSSWHEHIKQQAQNVSHEVIVQNLRKHATGFFLQKTRKSLFGTSHYLFLGYKTVNWAETVC